MKAKVVVLADNFYLKSYGLKKGLYFYSPFLFNFNFLGAVAQLVERVDGIHEVAGSIPVSST